MASTLAPLQSSTIAVLGVCAYRRKPMLELELGDPFPIPVEERRREHENGIGASPRRFAERVVEIGGGVAHLDGAKLDFQ